MLTSFPREQLDSLAPDALSDELEHGRIVHFPECPVDLPDPADLDFLRGEMSKYLNYKNISFHPEADKVSGIRGPREIVDRTYRILREHTARVQAFLRRTMPGLTRDWQVGTCSFRPMEERGRNLDSHASNERVHVDAGAYGATHGDRIVRFFVNVNPGEDRVWVSKGAFPDLYRRYAKEAGIQRPGDSESWLEEGFWDRFRTGTLRTLSGLNSQMKLLDSSPYDRAMRRFHNFMKDSREFQETPEGHREIRFRPYEAWMVFTDMLSHACVSGRFALVDTFVIPLRNCRHPDLAPINILKGR